MDYSTGSAMKARFEGLFPDYAIKFGAATSQDQILEVQRRFISEHKDKLRLALLQAGVVQASSDSDVNQVDNDFLDYPRYLQLINARGGEIKIQVQLILDGLERISKMPKTSSPEAITAQLIGFGALAVGATAGLTAFGVLSGAALATEAITMSASLAGVLAVGVAATVALAALCIGIVLIPFIYYMVKPAICMILLINELEEDIFLRVIIVFMASRLSLLKAYEGRFGSRQGKNTRTAKFSHTMVYSQRQNAIVLTLALSMALQ